MKYINLILLFALLELCSCTTPRKNIQKLSNKVTLEIDASGTQRRNRWVNFYVTVTNNSTQDIHILKPLDKYGDQINFFHTTTKCQQPTIVEAPRSEVILRKDSEIITIKAKSHKTLKVKGNLYNVICGGSNINVKISYNLHQIPDWLLKKMTPEQKQATLQLYKKLTKLKIESPETSIKLY